MYYIAKNYASLDGHRQREVYIHQLDKRISVFKYVFDPTLTNVTPFYIDALKVGGGEKVLDMACGTGVIGLYAALNGASYVLSADINPHAVACAQHNARRLGLDNVVEVRESDLLSNVPRDDEFDLICANLPLLEGDVRESYEKAIFDPDFHLYVGLMEGVGDYLREEGRIVIVCSNKRCPSGRNGVECVLDVGRTKYFTS